MGKVRGKTKEGGKVKGNGADDFEGMSASYLSNFGNHGHHPIASSSMGALNSTVGSSGRISKPASSKKNVSFRSNLTDVSTAELLNMGQMVSPMQMMAIPGSEFREPARSVKTSSAAGRAPKTITKKKDKMKAKKDEFQKKIANIQADDRERKEAAQRRTTPIVGDTRPLMNALPSIPSCSPAGPAAAAGNSSGGGGLNPLMDLAGFVATHQLDEFKTLPKKKINAKQRQKEIAEGLAYFAATMNYQPPIL